MRPRTAAAAAALACGAAAQWPPYSPWGNLKDGLTAWQQSGFNGADNFTFSVVELRHGDKSTDGARRLFSWPGDSPDTTDRTPDTVWKLVIEGAKERELLERVTQPFVEMVLQGKEPGDPAGRGVSTVWRRTLLEQGAGVTLPELVRLTGGKYHEGDEWQPLRDGLDAWHNLRWDVNFTFNVGNKDGTLLAYQKGSVGMDGPRLPGASLSKWPAAMTVAGLVADGTMSFHDKASKYLHWWTKDPADKRSNVTLRHLLSFQSGFMFDSDVDCAENATYDYLSCARELYRSYGNDSNNALPGTKFAYISTHLQFAGAMAVAASGLQPDELFKKYLYEPLGMVNTTWGEPPFKNPQFATGIRTIGADLEQFVRRMLTYEFLGKEVLDQAERDWSAPPVSPSGDAWFGHYAMGHWFDCLGYGAGRKMGASAPLPRVCLEENIQAGPGAFGYYNLIDRVRGYYMQIVLAEDPDCRSEVPEYLRAAAKPMVDAVIQGDPTPTTVQLLERGGGITLAEITDINTYIPPNCNPPSYWPY